MPNFGYFGLKKTSLVVVGIIKAFCERLNGIFDATSTSLVLQYFPTRRVLPTQCVLLFRNWKFFCCNALFAKFVVLQKFFSINLYCSEKNDILFFRQILN